MLKYFKEFMECVFEYGEKEIKEEDKDIIARRMLNNDSFMDKLDNLIHEEVKKELKEHKYY